MIPIYYPYWEGGRAWDELRYSFRSLEKFFQEDFTIYLVGDRPSWVKNVVHVPYIRDSRFGSLGNTSRMMELFMNWISAEGSDVFVRMHDDLYLIGDRTLEDLSITRIIRPAQEVKTMASGSELWRKQVFSTVYELQDLGNPGYMTESHCPEVFSCKKMQLIFKMFELPKALLLPSTLYFNVFPFERELIDKKAERALFYGIENEFGYASFNIPQKCAGKYFLNHNDTGLNDELKAFIKAQFPDKSRFEI